MGVLWACSRAVVDYAATVQGHGC